MDVGFIGLGLSEGGALNALGRNAIHISMSTISVALSDRLAEAHGKAGQGYVAAPVFGRPEAAAAARLFIIAAGADGTIARCQPLFDAMGQQTFVISAKPSEANLVKLTGNFLIASMLESLGEAFALVRKSGLDPHRYLNILTSTLLSAPVYRTYGSIIAEDRLPADGFKMSLGLKDMRLALAAADARTVPMPVASLVRDHFFEAVGTSCSRSPEGSNRTSSRISTKRHWSTSSTRGGRANPSRPRRGPAARMSSLVDALRQSIHQASSSLAKPAKKPRGRRLAKRRC
jgi:3-hydroxyisobutyrate dehydrogenase-like beta-hydroxyacid dehydrogenase